MMIPFTRWRILNFVVSSLIFVFISNQVAQATGKLTDWLCNKPPPSATKLPTNRGAPSTSNGSASQPAASTTTANGAEYVALSTSAKPPEDTEKAALEQEMAEMTLGENRRRQIPARIASIVWQDLRLKTLAVLVSLWALNWVYPGDVASGHILPLH